MLVDEFGQISCDDFLARIDGLYTQINANPGSKGYFVISGSKEVLTGKLGFELLFETAVRQQGHDSTVASIIRGNESGPLDVKIWIAKAGSELPSFGATKWDLRMRPGSTPFRLRSDMAQICDPPRIDRVARDLVDSNPDGSIFVVVHGPNAHQRRVEFKVARKMLTGFDATRIRYLLRHSQTSYSDYYFALGKPKRSDFKSYF